MPKPAPNTTAALAQALGISRWTVSRVLNGHNDVKDETVQRVRQAMIDLDFQPSSLARGLRGGQTATVGVCFQDLDSPVLAMRAASLQQRLRDHGFHTVIELSGNCVDLERSAIRRFVSQHIDGVVSIFSRLTADDPVIRLLERKGIPSFWVDPEHPVPGDKAILDRDHSMMLILQHLTSLGHRKFTLFGIEPSNRFGALRVPGLSRHAPAFGLDFDRDFSFLYHCGEVEHTFNYGCELAGEWISQARENRPSAIIALNDRIAIGAINRLREAGISVPNDVSVIGYDNIQVAEHYFPSLTTVDHQTDRLMDLAVRQLIDRIASKSTADHDRTSMVQPKLVIRQSTGKPPLA